MYSLLAISDNRLSCQNTNTNYHWKKILPGKKGTVIWPSQITVCRVKIQTPTITGKISTGKKVQLSGRLR